MNRVIDPPDPADPHHTSSTLSMPLDDGEFTPAERLAIRKMLRSAIRASDRRKWAARQLRITLPISAVSGTTLWGVIEWLRTHVTLQ